MRTLLSLRARARKLWPASPRNQREWLRAVRLVRSTKAGWHLDKTAPHKHHA